MQAAVEFAQKQRRSIQCINLHVDTVNEPAISLYQSLGFVTEALLEDYYQPGSHAFKMTADCKALLAKLSAGS